MSRKKREIPVAVFVAAVAFIGLAVVVAYSKEISRVAFPSPFSDEPPRLTFTWTPGGTANLATMKAHLRMTDDHALDFATYTMTIAEAGKTTGFPVEGVIGRDYETDLSFSWLAEDPRLAGAGRMTVTFTIADDKGQKGSLTRVIPLQNWRPKYPKNVQDRLDAAAAMDTSSRP